MSSASATDEASSGDIIKPITPKAPPDCETSQPQTTKWLNKDFVELVRSAHFKGLGDIAAIDKQIDEFIKGKNSNGCFGPITTDDDYDRALLGDDDWEDIEIEVTLDSGCVDHVMDAGEAPV